MNAQISMFRPVHTTPGTRLEWSTVEVDQRSVV